MRIATSRSWAARVNVIAASPLLRDQARAAIYRRAGIQIGAEPLIRPHCWLFSDQLEIGDGVLIGHHCRFENRELVRVGDRCSIAPEVTITTSTHEIGGPDKRAGDYSGAPVTIGAGCWIGTRAVILPGVTIGEGCVIAAGAVVRRDCAPNGLYAGVPERRKADLDAGQAEASDLRLPVDRLRDTHRRAS